MDRLEVPSPAEVLEGLRRDIVANLRAQGFEVPSDAQVEGNCRQAMLAYQRLTHRKLSAVPRTVQYSPELLAGSATAAHAEALKIVASEFEHGEDMTQRLTRHFFRSGFNDFLFNNFGIHHLHLGTRNLSRDRTRNHPMASGGKDLLFAWVTPSEAYLLDILDHHVFDNAAMSKKLVQIALRERPDFVRAHVAEGVTGAEQSFEGAFEIAKAGFVTGYELGGHFFLTGGTVLDGRVGNGRRGACTSIRVVVAANRALNRVVEFVDHLRQHSEALAEVVARATGVRPAKFELEVVKFGNAVLLRDRSSGVEFALEGVRCGYRVPGTVRFTPLKQP